MNYRDIIYLSQIEYMIKETGQQHKIRPQLTQCCDCRENKTLDDYVEISQKCDDMLKKYFDYSHSYCSPCLEKQYTEIAILDRIYAKNIQQY